MTDAGDDGRARAMRFVASSLAARAQSVAEIERKLASRGVPPDVAADVVVAACELRYLDDRELAAQLARGLRLRGYGRRRAALALGRRGLAGEHAEAALEAAFGDVDETALAAAALRSRTIVDTKEERRAVAFLVRRGFSSAAAWSAVRARRSGEP
jgi:regulatory protein